MDGLFSVTVMDKPWYDEDFDCASVLTYDDLSWENVLTLAQWSLTQCFEVIIDRREVAST